MSINTLSPGQSCAFRLHIGQITGFSVTMSLWIPDISHRPGPIYATIVDALAEAVAAGELARGAKLPPHRDMAHGLGVTVGTVSRAYKEAERRGLIMGEVGRGTFVTGRPADPLRPVHDARNAHDANDIFSTVPAQPDAPVNFRMNCPVAPNNGRDLQDALTEVAASATMAEMMEYAPECGLSRHRKRAAQWAGWAGLTGDESNIIITNGAQHAMTLVFSAMLCPGDTVLCDELSYPGLHFLADLLHLKLRPVAGDPDGILPDALEAACRSGTARALYLMPTVHNPCNTVMSEDRRRRLAAIAEKHRVWVVEDDVYGFLAEDHPPALTAFAPTVGFYINSASKMLSAGLRVGMIFAPSALCARLANSMRATSWMTAPLNAEIVLRWIADGTALRFRDWHRHEAASRLAIIETALQGFEYDSLATGYHIWLKLPDYWRNSDFVAAAQNQGVWITGADRFAQTRGMVPNAVRICYGTETDPARLRQGIETLAVLLKDPNASGRSLM